MLSQKEAEKIYRKGQKCLSTGLFQWKKDYTGAVIQFDQSAKAFTALGLTSCAIDSYKYLAECYTKLNDPWAAGRSFESLASLSLQTDQVLEATNYASKAAELFRVNGSSDKALNMLHDFGRTLAQRGLIELACKMYSQAIKVISEDQLFFLSKDVINSYATLLVEQNLLPAAVEVYEKEIVFAAATEREHQVFKAALCIFAIAFLTDASPSDKYSQLCSDIRNFVMSDESQVASDILDAVRQGSQEQFDRATRRAVWNNVELPLVRLMRSYKIVNKATLEPAAIEDSFK